MSLLDLQVMRRFDGDCILSVGGEVDESTVAAFERALDDGVARSRRLVVDLTTSTMSSDGLAALIRFHRRTCDRAAVTLVAGDSCLLRMLEIVGLTARLGTHPTVNAALSSDVERAPVACRTSFGRTRRPAALELVVQR